MSDDEVIRNQGDLVVRATATLTSFSALIERIEANMSADHDHATPEDVLKSADRLIDELDANIRRLGALFDMEFPTAPLPIPPKDESTND